MRAASAALAAAVMLHCFGTNKPAQMIAGITTAIWPGRIQRLDDGKLTALAPNCEIWVDGAHNAHGAQARGPLALPARRVHLRRRAAPPRACHGPTLRRRSPCHTGILAPCRAGV